MALVVSVASAAFAQQPADAPVQADGAAEWQKAGIDPAEARQWIAAEIPFAQWARQWKSEGFTAAEARGWMRAQTPSAKARAEGVLTETIRSLLVLVEAYPSLKADAHFADLMKQLRELEDAIEYARRYYNANTRDYNIAIGVFPSNIVAGTFGFAEEEFFALSPDSKAREVPQVAFRSTPEGTRSRDSSNP